MIQIRPIVIELWAVTGVRCESESFVLKVMEYVTFFFLKVEQSPRLQLRQAPPVFDDFFFPKWHIHCCRLPRRWWAAGYLGLSVRVASPQTLLIGSCVSAHRGRYASASLRDRQKHKLSSKVGGRSSRARTNKTLCSEHSLVATGYLSTFTFCDCVNKNLFLVLMADDACSKNKCILWRESFYFALHIYHEIRI